MNDLDGLLKISRTTFINAFKKDNNPDDFKDYINSAFSIENIKTQLSNPDSFFYFTYNNDDLVGYFKINQKGAQTESFNHNALELERIYVLNKFQGQQLGKQMLFKTIELAKSKNAYLLWLGVWEKNSAAIRFYQRYGFVKFDTHHYYIGKDKQTDWLMKLNLV